MDAYLDIETSYSKEITIIGVYRDDVGLRQLIDKTISPSNILETLRGVTTIYTYNGNRFDIPVIAQKTGLNLKNNFTLHDLMFDCWSKKLFGGLKAVERKLGIARDTAGMDGEDAMRLWEDYCLWKDEEALARLLKYNGEDVVNLKTLREKLENRNALKSYLGEGSWNF